jgi:hypothetical protein
MFRLSVAVASLGAYTPEMWKAVRLILCLAFFVPAFALLGAFATLDGGARTAWPSLVEFPGQLFPADRRVTDLIHPPEIAMLVRLPAAVVHVI